MWILSGEGTNPKVSDLFFKDVTQVVLLFGEDACVLTLRMNRALSSFQQNQEATKDKGVWSSD